MAKDWHHEHLESRTPGQVIADAVARGMGSWPFIITQTVLVVAWITLNLIAWVQHWDPYPFILLNLLFSVQAAYAAPIIMMSQNRQSERDRVQAQADFETNVRAESEVKRILDAFERLEREHLLPIAEKLNEIAPPPPADARQE